MNKYCTALLIFFFLLFSHLGMGQPEVFKIGVATRMINNEVGNYVQGAGTLRRATRIRDNLEANAMYFSKGNFQLLMISCDLVGLESSYVVRLREAMGVASGIAPRNILISCTHTHGGPSLLRTNYTMPVDTAYMERLQKWMVDLASEAVKVAQPGKIGWAKGEAQIGFNRRVTWADGTHTMHGDTRRKDFAGLEGPVDPQHLAMFASDMKGKLMAVLYNNTSHPTIFYGAGIYSADFPGEVRKTIRNKIGRPIPVLFLNGAQGDISVENMLNHRAETVEEKLKRVSELVVSKTMELYKNVSYDDNPVLKHDYHDLKVALRRPSVERLIESRNTMARFDKGENIGVMETILSYGAIRLEELYVNNPFEILPIHAVRIGDIAIVTQPCELYCQFGLDIKRRSPASTTAVVGLTDGHGGYCPTIYGILGGGYSGAPIAWCRLEPYAGYKIVETAAKLLNGLFRD